MKQAATLLTGLALLVTATGSASAPDDQKQADQMLMDAIPGDTISDVELFDSNGFRIGSSRNKELGADLQPSGSEFEGVVITADDIFKVTVEKGRPMSSGGGVGIFHRTTGEPMLTASDQSGDGRIDIVSYSVIGDDGEAIREVVDYDADGQANLRVHFNENYAEIWHGDRWHRLEKKDGQRGILVDGEFRKVESEENRLVVQ